LARVPCSMVGDKAGILMSIGMDGVRSLGDGYVQSVSGQIVPKGQEPCAKY